MQTTVQLHMCSKYAFRACCCIYGMVLRTPHNWHLDVCQKILDSSGAIIDSARMYHWRVYNKKGGLKSRVPNSMDLLWIV
jgi:hypothetical protein